MRLITTEETRRPRRAVKPVNMEAACTVVPGASSEDSTRMCTFG